MTAYVITPANSVVAPGGAAFSKNEAAASSLTVNVDAYLISTAAFPANAAELSGSGNWTVNVKGSLSNFATGGSGLFLSRGLSTSLDTVNIDKTGSVYSVSYGVASVRDLTLNNKGSIEGDEYGVFTNATTADMTVVNSGVIDGGSVGVFGRGKTKVTNSGTIINSEEASGYSILSLGALDLSNSGKLIGDVAGSAGSDIILNHYFKQGHN